MNRFPVLLAIALASVLAFGVAPAQAGWSFPETISGTPARDPDVAVNARGDAIVAWHVSAPDIDPNAPGFDPTAPHSPRAADPVETRFRPALGHFDPVERVAPGRPTDAASPDAPTLSAPAVAIAADGTAFVAWTEFDADGGAPGTVHVRTRPPGGEFGPEETVPALRATAYDNEGGTPALVSDARGNLALAWKSNRTRPSYQSDETGNVLMVAERPAGGRFGAPRDVTVGGRSVYRFSLDVNALGLTALTWVSTEADARGTPATRIDVATGPAGGELGPPVRLGAGLPQPSIAYDAPRVTVDPQGDVGVTWASGGPGAGSLIPGYGNVHAAIRPAGTPDFHVVSPSRDGSRFGAVLALRSPEDFYLGYSEDADSRSYLKLAKGGLVSGLRTVATLALPDTGSVPYREAQATGGRIWFTWVGFRTPAMSVTTDSRGRFLEPQPGGGTRVDFDAVGRGLGVSAAGSGPEGSHIVASDLALDTPSIALAGIARKRERRGTAVRRNNAALRVCPAPPRQHPRRAPRAGPARSAHPPARVRCQPLDLRTSARQPRTPAQAGPLPRLRARRRRPGQALAADQAAPARPPLKSAHLRGQLELLHLDLAQQAVDLARIDHPGPEVLDRFRPAGHAEA